MSDLISRCQLFNRLAPVQTLGEAYGVIQGMPTVDAVPVVRCKDCKYWRDTDHTCRGHSLVSPMTADDFCSYGVRKDGNRDEP